MEASTDEILTSKESAETTAEPTTTAEATETTDQPTTAETAGIEDNNGNSISLLSFLKITL